MKKNQDVMKMLNKIDKKPQMNADERRYLPATYFIKTTHRKGRKERKAMQHEPLLSCVTKTRYGINNELGRTDTNSGYSEFVRVRISSLLTSILFLSLRPLRSLRLNVFSTPAHGRAPPQPALAVHLRLSRALRHLIVHKSGIVDNKFKNDTQTKVPLNVPYPVEKKYVLDMISSISKVVEDIEKNIRENDFLTKEKDVGIEQEK